MSQQLLAFALIAIPCIIIALGLVIDRFIDSFTVDGSLAYMSVVMLIPAALVFLSRSLFKRNASPLRMASRWTLKSYEENIAGLDERERQVIDQAYRMSYRIVALACWLAMAAVFASISFWHLTYHLGLVGIVWIMLGIIDLLSFLPTAIVVWKEQV
jgi:hypothetical protein